MYTSSIFKNNNETGRERQRERGIERKKEKKEEKKKKRDIRFMRGDLSSALTDLVLGSS